MNLSIGDETRYILMPTLAYLVGRDSFEMDLPVWNFGLGKISQVLWENRIVLRGLQVLKDRAPIEFLPGLEEKISEQWERTKKILKYLELLMEKLDFEFVFIKTPDNYPDFGHDVDVLTKISGKEVRRLLGPPGFRELSQTLAERIADKVNFVYEDYCNLEVHCGRLGELGEHVKLVHYILEGKRKETVGGVEVWVPSWEARVLLITLQRLYRHFNLRGCDVYNVITWYREGKFSVDTLFGIADSFGLLPGVKGLLRFVNEVNATITGELLFDDPSLAPLDELYCDRGLIRFDRKRYLPRMYWDKWKWDVSHGEWAALTRELLVIPLSLLAVFYLKVLGKEGIW